jgi:hypothetical protein
VEGCFFVIGPHFNEWESDLSAAVLANQPGKSNRHSALNDSSNFRRFEKLCATATMTPGSPVFGGIAQLVERVVRNDEAWGSNPHTSSLRSPRSGERRLSRRSLGRRRTNFDRGYVFAASFDRACQFFKMGTFTYVHVLQSEIDPQRFYTGCTSDLRARLIRHNNGEVPYTSKMESVASQYLHRIFGSRSGPEFREISEICLGARLHEKAVVEILLFLKCRLQPQARPCFDRK